MLHDDLYACFIYVVNIHPNNHFHQSGMVIWSPIFMQSERRRMPMAIAHGFSSHGLYDGPPRVTQWSSSANLGFGHEASRHAPGKSSSPPSNHHRPFTSFLALLGLSRSMAMAETISHSPFVHPEYPELAKLTSKISSIWILWIQ